MNERKHFYFWHIGAALAAAVLLIGVFEFTSLDFTINNLFYDPIAHKFPLRRNAFIEIALHQCTKYLVAMIALGAIVAYLASFRVDALRPKRRALFYIWMGLVCATSAVAFAKALSPRHCPYDLAMYGGFAPYLGLFDSAPAGLKLGGCFPGAHASGGFALMVFYFLWHRHQPQRARFALIGALIAGFIMGTSRLIQGAHFMSHNLWSALLVWVVLLLLYWLILDARDYPRAKKSG
jgi:membrane-associated PAP2 superfamily phosphatase